MNAQSLYVAAFRELESAFQEFAAGGTTRVVVFVDDLDRCLPASALEVLEAIKLFFDLPGFISSSGSMKMLSIAQFGRSSPGLVSRSRHRTCRARDYRRNRCSGANTQKKYFQVPYSLPTMLPEQLGELLESMYREAGLADSSFADVRTMLWRYLRHVTIERNVNPREVKRFINSYTLQTLIRPELDADTVLALQTLAFRYDWEPLYNAVVNDSAMFVDILRRYRDSPERDNSAFEDLSPDLLPMPPGLLGFLLAEEAAPLARHSTLDAYVTSLEATRSSRSWELDALREVGHLSREIRKALSRAHLTDAALATALDAARETASILAGRLPAEYQGDARLSLQARRLRSLATAAATQRSPTRNSAERHGYRSFRLKWTASAENCGCSAEPRCWLRNTYSRKSGSRRTGWCRWPAAGAAGEEIEPELRDAAPGPI